jgi:thiamine transport system substrate-binding protein
MPAEEIDMSLPIWRSAAVSAALCVSISVLIAGCGSPTTSSNSDDRDVTLITHDSFPSKEFAKAASKATGYRVHAVTAGDGGELTNKLVLTQSAPVADAFYGVDNFFASRIVDEGVVDDYTPKDLPQSAQKAATDGLVPVDRGAVCLNIDTKWFDDHDLPEPKSYEDLTAPKYKGLSVLLDPASSSTGMAFLVGTVSKFGENGFAKYWKDLVANDAKIENGWTEAYNGQFTQGGGDGSYPIVVSYDSSPAWTLSENGKETTTKALLKTCTSQVEYAGVLQGAKNSKGAQAVLDYLVSREFQDTIAGTMYMNPIDGDADVPPEWSKFVESPADLNDLPVKTVGDKRDAWLKTWDTAVQ